MTPNDEGKMFTATEAKQLRESLIRKWVLPALEKRFEKYPELKSVGMLVAQYWCDEANDAVHLTLIYSVLETPDFQTAIALEYGEPDPINLPGLPSHNDIDWLERQEFIPWDDNGIAIPAFAAFCREDCDQEMTTAEVCSLFAIFRKTEDGFDIEYVGEMIRPWLDGISPEFYDFGEMDEEKAEQIKAEYLESLDA